MSSPMMKLQTDKTRQAGGSPLQMLELSLPIPLDQQEKVRALNYLHKAVQTYIDDFCSGTGDPERPARRHPERPRARRRSLVKGVSMSQAIQVFLCFYLCLFI